MATNFLRKPSLGVSPLQGLASYFEQARQQAGTLTVPENTLQTIKEYRERGSEHSVGEVAIIVRALEAGTPQLCLRLEHTGLIFFCSVFLHSQTCLAQQRGLFLLTEALYTTANSDGLQTFSIDSQAKKEAVGRHVLIALIKGFAGSGSPDQTRKWMGILALELLKGCPQNATALRFEYRRTQLLSTVIKHGKCQVLKLLAGSMINILWNHGVMLDLMWSDKADRDWYSHFPTARFQDTGWIIRFEGWVESLSYKKVLTEEKSAVIFAYALLVGETRYSTNDESAILVTVSENLNVVIPDSTTGPATYVDVPLENVSSVTIGSQTNSQSQTLSFVLTIQLSSNGGYSCLVNAAAKDYLSIALAFTSDTDAKTLETLLQPKMAEAANSGRISVSEGIDVTRGWSDGERDHESPDLTMASYARTPQPDTRQSASFESQAQNGGYGIQGPQRNISVAFGLDVSLTDGIDNDQADIGIDRVLNSNAPSADHNDANAPRNTAFRNTDGFEVSSDAGLLTSTRHHNGFEAIKNALESEPQANLPSGRQARKIQTSLAQADEYDSSYDVSPQADKSRSYPAKESMPPPPLPFPAPTQKEKPNIRARQSRSRATKVSTPKSPAPDVDTGHATNEPTTSDAPTTKISRRLRNGDDKTKMDQELPAEIDRKPVAEVGVPKKARAKAVPKTKVSPSTTTKARVQKRKNSPKKETVPTHMAEAMLDHVGNAVDEYDLQDSPEVPKPTRTPIRTAPNARAVQEAKQNTELAIDMKIQPLSRPSVEIDGRPLTRSRFKGVARDESTRDEDIKSSTHNPKSLERDASQSAIAKSAEASSATVGQNASTKSMSKSRAVSAAPTKPKSKRTAAVKSDLHRVSKMSQLPSRNGQTHAAGHAAKAQDEPRDLDAITMADPADGVHDLQDNFTVMGENEGSYLHGTTGNIEEGLLSSESTRSLQDKGTVATEPSLTSVRATPVKSSKRVLDTPSNQKDTKEAFPGPNRVARANKSSKFKVTDMGDIGSRATKQRDNKLQKTNTVVLQPTAVSSKLQHENDGFPVSAPSRSRGSGEVDVDNDKVETPERAVVAAPEHLGHMSGVVEDAPTKAPAPIIGNDPTKEKTPMPAVGKKPGLISWDKSGPRNQGTISEKKVKPRQDVSSLVSGDEHPDRHQRKRKIATHAEGPASIENDHPAKRQKQDFTTPRQSRKYVPKPGASPYVRHENLDRLSSQSTKVNVEGSPLPPIISQNEVRDGSDSTNDFQVSFTDDDDAVDRIEGSDASQSQPPAPSTVSDPKAKVVKAVKINSNSKQQPSSPGAPSAMTSGGRHIEIEGKLIHEETLETIVPTEAQNPFALEKEKSPGSFVGMLREWDDFRVQSNKDKAIIERNTVSSKRKSIALDEEPENLLVESERPNKRQKSTRQIVPDSSGLSGSTTLNETQTEGEEDDETRQWRKAASKPEEVRMLDVLTVITHRLVRHLVDKEDDAMHITVNYQKGGKNLMDAYEKARQEALESGSTGLDQVKLALSGVYGDALAHARKITNELANDPTKRRTRALQAVEEQRRRHMEGSSKTIMYALESCFE